MLVPIRTVMFFNFRRDEMERRKLGQIAVAGLGMLLLSTPAFAQEAAGGLDLIENV